MSGKSSAYRSRAGGRVSRPCRSGTRVALFTMVGAGLCALMVAVSIGTAVFRAEPVGQSGWLWFATAGTLLAFAFLAMATRLWVAANNERVRAMYADGQESVGTVIKVVEDDDRDPDTGPYHDITITAAVAGTGSIRRVICQAAAPRIGQPLRFRHHTLDPEDLEDAVGLVKSSLQVSSGVRGCRWWLGRCPDDRVAVVPCCSHDAVRTGCPAAPGHCQGRRVVGAEA